MKRVHEAWRKIESKAPPHKGNGADPDAAPIMTDGDAVIFPLATDVQTQPLDDSESVLEQCRATDWHPDAKVMLFSGSEGSARAKEDFRALRSRLCQMRERTPLRTLAVVSALPKEGRSFVAANLAQAMTRQQGCRVLLVDADLRNPSLHSILGTRQAPGLSEFLLDEAEELSLIQKGTLENLFFLAAGSPASASSDIISNGRLRTLLERLSTVFDWIVVDSPAALPVSDAELIANSCDGVLLVVRSNSTPFDLVRKARSRFREEHVLGVVLNGIPVEKDIQNQYNHDCSGESKPNGKWK